MYKIIFLFLVISIFTSTLLAQKSARIIQQKKSPINIISYEADYQKGGTYTSAGIRHEVEYQNQTKRLITAIQIGLVAFDV